MINTRLIGIKSASIFNLFLFYAFKNIFMVCHIHVGTTGMIKEYRIRCLTKKNFNILKFAKLIPQKFQLKYGSQS
jgi:hypothetical protein